MLNPEILKIYGTESKPMFEQLIVRIGEYAASTCYAVPGMMIPVKGVNMPRAMTSTLDNPINVRMALNDFIEKNTSEEFDSGITILHRLPEKGDIKLWL